MGEFSPQQTMNEEDVLDLNDCAVRKNLCKLRKVYERVLEDERERYNAALRSKSGRSCRSPIPRLQYEHSRPRTFLVL